MNIKLLSKIVMFVAAIHVPVAGMTAGSPSVPFEVSGVIFDWETKQPLEDVRFIIFMNDAPFADNDGWVAENDYPDFPRSNADGEFSVSTKLYKASQHVEVSKIEVIVFKEGYRAERIVINQPGYTLDDAQQLGQIKLSDFYLFKTRHHGADKVHP